MQKGNGAALTFRWFGLSLANLLLVSGPLPFSGRMLDGKATEHVPYTKRRVEESGTNLSQNKAEWHCLSVGKRRPGQLPARCIPSLSRKAGGMKVSLSCPAELLRIFKASRAQVAIWFDVTIPGCQ